MRVVVNGCGSNDGCDGVVSRVGSVYDQVLWWNGIGIRYGDVVQATMGGSD